MRIFITPFVNCADKTLLLSGSKSVNSMIDTSRRLSRYETRGYVCASSTFIYRFIHTYIKLYARQHENIGASRFKIYRRNRQSLFSF